MDKLEAKDGLLRIFSTISWSSPPCFDLGFQVAFVAQREGGWRFLPGHAVTAVNEPNACRLHVHASPKFGEGER
jgi:hypothetical protein